MGLQYLHGIEVIEIPDAGVNIETVATGVIGLIGTAPGADPEAYPINTPFLLAGNPVAALKFGNEGTIPDAIDAIFKQIGATIIVVRIEEGTSSNAATRRLQTYANIVGNPQAKTGIWAFTKSNSILKIVPKILIAPGFTSERPIDGILDTASVSTGGTGYHQHTTTVAFTGGGGQGAEGTVLVNGSGAVQAVIVTKPGVGYTTAPTVVITDTGTPAVYAADGVTVLTAAVPGGTGAAVTVTVGTVANPVAVELVSLAPKLGACAIVDTDGTSYEEAIAYRDDFDTDRLKIIDGGFRYFDANTAEIVTTPAAAYAAGLQALMDNQRGFWWDFSNQPVSGIVGTGRSIPWSYFDPNVEGQLLNSQSVAVCVHNTGFKIMGVRTPTSDNMWMFWSVRRTADAVYASIEYALTTAIDRPISLALIDWIELSVNNYLNILKQRGAILGGKAWLNPDFNTPADLLAGHLVIDFDIEPPAPLERLTFQAHRNAGYYVDLINEVLQTAQ